MGKITKNYIYNLIYQMVSMLIPLFTAPYLSRILGPIGTGIYGYVNSATTLICSIVILGIYNYGNRQIAYVRDDPDAISNVFWQIMSSRVVIAIFGSVVYFAVTMSIGKYRSLFLIYYSYMIGYFIDPTWLFVGVEDMKWALLKNMLTKIIAVVSIFLFVKDSNDIDKYLFIQGISIALANAISFTQIKRYVRKPHLDFSNVKTDLINSALLFLPSVGTIIYTQCDKIMIELMTDNSQAVAFYDYSEKILTIPLAFILAINNAIMPRIANEFKRENKEQIQSLLNKSARCLLFISFPAMLGMIAISEKFIPWYLGNEFIPTVQAIKVMAPILLTNTLMGVSGSQYFTATNQVKILMLSQFSAMILNILVNAVLIPKYGFMGAAFATILTSCVCAVIQYVYMTKQIKFEGILRTALYYAVQAVIMYFVIAFATRTLPSKLSTTFLQILIGGSVYFVCAVLAKDRLVKEVFSKIRTVFYHSQK